MTLSSSLAKGFKPCIECKYIHVVSGRKTKQVNTKRFGIGNKTIDKVVEEMTKMQKSVPEGCIGKITKSYYSDYEFKIERIESDEEVFKRFRKSLDLAEKSEAAKEKKDDILKANREKRAKQEVQRQKQKEIQLKREAKVKERKDKERKKLEEFLSKNGLSLDSVREVLVG